MKKTIFSLFFLTAAIACFTGCMKSDAEGEAATLIVKLPGCELTKAIDGQVPSSTTATLATTDRVVVFLLNGTTVVGEGHLFTTDEITAKYKRFEMVSASVNRVVVVGKIPTTVDIAAFQALTNYGAIVNYAYTLASQQTGTGVQNLTIMGEGVPVVGGTDPGPFPAEHETSHIYKEVTIALDALTARFEVGAVRAGVGIEQVELVAVFINNYWATNAKGALQSHPMGNTVFSITPTSGVSATPFSTVTVTNAYTHPQFRDLANNDVATGVTLATGSRVYAYHLFAGQTPATPSSLKNGLPHLILLIKGQYATGYYEGSNRYFLGWVTFTQYRIDASTLVTTIENNKIYKMGVGETGIVITPEIITPDPEMEEFDLGIAVTVTPWTAVTVTPEV
jgi:hypothetical protein